MGESPEELVRYEDVELQRAGKIVLKDVSFSLQKGKFYYLTGRVGSGKSTLLKSMYGEVPISMADCADVLGYNLLKLKKKEIPYLRRKLGIVFQDFQLLTDRSVFSNLKYVLKATGWKDRHEIEHRIHEVLTAVGMENKSYKHPHELSGGEQQRIVIARALLNRPELILADEPTGNLDPTTGYYIITLLHELAERGHTILMATHNLQLVEEFPGCEFRCEDGQLFIDK
ncbi:MAG: ATP-binding cassette domain-containing protein [Muribaculaceae bacterium]|nr:ATP-binding cassette domain-containing protein [Muribaculaceae bacterium]